MYFNASELFRSVLPFIFILNVEFFNNYDQENI